MREGLAILAVMLAVACGEERKSDAELQAAVGAYLAQDVGAGAGDAKLAADGDAAGLSDGDGGADGATDAGGDGDGGVDGDGPVDASGDVGDGEGQDSAEVLDPGPCPRGNCDDGNPCTTDSCNPAVGCQSVNIAAACDDGNACTTADVCTDGACKGVGPVCGNGACDCGETNASCAADCKAGPPVGMVLIPAGTFWMGCNAVKDASCNSSEKPQHKVTLSAYYMDETETTVGLYKACVDAGVCASPSTVQPDQSATYPGLSNHPVNYVSWSQAQVHCKWRGTGFDLPTEAQWEMAARGSCEKNGSIAGDAGCAAAMRTFPWGEASPTESQAVFSVSGTGPVGSKALGESPYGLKDMAGNVSEWTRDWYSAYGPGSTTDPAGPASGSGRVYRGGTYGSNAPGVRASQRSDYAPSAGNYDRGFRCARSYP